MKKILLINLVVIAVLIELLAAGFYYFENQSLFYTRQQQTDQSNELLENIGKKNLLLRQTKHVFHPTLGYTLRPGLSIKNSQKPDQLKRLKHPVKVDAEWTETTANNYGFFSTYNYPYQANDNEVIVGIFGGSVAQWFALQTQQHLKHRLAEKLFPGKKIVVLNFASGGYKQPQQLNTLNYFMSLGQQFDLVINIDGYNELNLAYGNIEHGIDLAQPSYQLIKPLATLIDNSNISPAALEKIALVQFYRQQLSGIREKMNRSKIASQWLFFRIKAGNQFQYQHQAVAAYKELLKEPQNNNALIRLYPPQLTADKSTLQLYDNWLGSSLSMQAILEKRGIPYFHFIQPNQYFTKKKMSDAEKNIALNNMTPNIKQTAELYAGIKAELEKPQWQSLNIFDATAVFDSTEEIVFADSCCHYNQLGNDILHDHIIDNIVIPKNTTR